MLIKNSYFILIAYFDGSFKGKHQNLNEQGILWIILMFI